MNNYRLFNKSSSYFVLDKKMIIVNALNFDKTLFFGIEPIKGRSIVELLGENHISGSEVIIEGILRAWNEQRNSCFEYASIVNGNKIYVAANIEYCVDEGLYLYLHSLNYGDTVKQNRLESSNINNEKTRLAIKSADIMLWEFDVKSKLFFSDNEVLNGFDNSKPISPNLYLEVIHEMDRDEMGINIKRMYAGEDFSFNFEGRIILTENAEWQYCSISGSPFERDESGLVTKYVGTRKNNTELHRRKQLQDNILNSLDISVHIKDVENNFQYVFCNDESKRMFGTSEDKTAYDIMDTQAVERIQKTDYETYLTGKPYKGFERIQLKDGRVYDTIVRKSVIVDRGRTLLLTSRWDQGLQNDLMRRSKLLTITMEAMNAFTWYLNPEKGRISFGDGFDKVGLRSTDVNTVAKYVECIHPDDRDHFSNSLSEIIVNEKGILDIEYRLDLNGEGIYKWWQTKGMFEEILINDSPYKYMFGMTICIEEYKTTEHSLLQNKEELKNWIHRNELILNNTNSSLVYITTDYVVQWENISLSPANLFYGKYIQGELCYKSSRDCDTPCADCVMQRAMISQQVEHTTLSLNDNKNTVDIFATPVFDRDNKISGIVVRIDDVTERETMIRELREAKIQAEQSDKLKSAFLANMSHEIRTPLNAIVGFSEMLVNCSDEEKEEYMQIISTNNDLLLKLINDILDLSKIEAGSIELKYDKFDIANYFDDLSSSMRLRINNSKVTLVDVNPYPTCKVFLDCNRVAQILTNYVTNAIKYTPEGSIVMGYERRKSSLYLYVKDSGIGIPDEKLNKVFHRFEKLDDFAQGTGLGLSICKAIAESMGGKVGFNTQYGVGSTFWAELPCRFLEEDEANILAKESDAHVINHTVSVEEKRRMVILVAEDILSNFQLLSSILKKQYDLVHAWNGEEAIEVLHNRKIDFMFMDMKMPVMDGLTATSKIREFNTELPIVALTAHAFDSDKQLALNAGCDDYLVKPVSRAQIMDVLKSYGVIPSID